LNSGIGIDGRRVNLTSLEANSALEIETGRASIARHTLHLPVGNAIVGSLLMDEFQEYAIDMMFASILDCFDLAGRLTALVAAEIPGLTTKEQRDDLRDGAETACHDTVDEATQEVLDALAEDFAAAGIAQDLILEGEADVSTLPDGTVRSMKGQWLGLGPFSAERY
jgi:hypothetical protein